MSARGTLLIGLALIGAAVAGFAAGSRRETPPTPATTDTALTAERDQVARERDWIRYFYRQYGAYMRYRDYGRIDPEIFALYGAQQAAFVDIDDVYLRRVCPPPSDGVIGKSFLYFGARLIVLPSTAALPDALVLTYHGNAEWTHQGRSFDALVTGASLRDGGRTRDLTASTGVLTDWYTRRDTAPLLAGAPKFYRPLSYNSGDLDGDGFGDLMLGDELVLSTSFNRADATFRRATPPIAIPGESIFLPGQRLITLNGGDLVQWRWQDGGLARDRGQRIDAARDANAAFALLPLPARGDTPALAIRLAERVTIFTAPSGSGLQPVFDLTGFQDGELLTGAFGDFTRDTTPDFWIAQPRWKNAAGKTVGRLWLIDGAATSGGAIDERAVTVVTGSERFTNYDGIGSTLSLIAGDIDRDGRADLSFTGHRHLDEAGAMFIIPGSRIAGGAISVERADVIKLRGRAVSQLAPPFNHWDAADFNGDGYDDILVAADNDMCAGLNAGALYVVDGKRLLDAWRGIQAGADRTR
jgi:hypothetical protein